MVCYWIYDANGDQIKEIEKEQNVVNSYFILLEKS